MKTIPSPRPLARADVAAFEELTRALIGVTLEGLDALHGAVTVPQFRLLLALDSLGCVPSSVLAGQMGMAASSVTRLADRLESAGLLVRGRDERNRCIVTVEVSDAGRDLVTAVLARRHALFEAVLDAMEPAERTVASSAARHFAQLAGKASEVGASGPVPL